jgi:large subunit ribosomal protein L31
MKANLHPNYNPEAVATCACGNKLTVGSTQAALEVVVCSNCHPFYTGAQTFADTQGRIEQFRARQKGAKADLKKKSKTGAGEVELAPKSLREMLTTK